MGRQMLKRILKAGCYLAIIVSAVFLMMRTTALELYPVEDKQPPYVYLDGKLYFVRTPLFDNDVGDPSTWDTAGRITSNCRPERIPKRNGQINFDLYRLVEPVVYRSTDDLLFVHLFENDISPFRGLVPAE